MRAVRGDGEQRPAAGRQAALAVAATCALAVLVAWAALIGPERVFTGPGPTPSSETTSPTESVLEEDRLREDAEDGARPADPPWWARLLVWVFEALVLLVVLALLVVGSRALVDVWRRRRRTVPELREDPGFETLAAGARVEAAVRDDAAAQDAVLAEGSARNAIVAAWHRFEVQGERAGVRRREWETSSEFTLRMLDEAGADSAAVTRLGELYREARFSRHEVDEEHRVAAVEALAAIRASLGSLR